MRLLLPLAPGDNEPLAPPAEIEERPSPLRILVIDDDPLLRQSLQDVLQIEGHLVTVADWGRRWPGSVPPRPDTARAVYRSHYGLRHAGYGWS